MNYQVRFYCLNCLQYVIGMREVQVTGARPTQCANTRCRAESGNLLAIEVPTDFPASLGSAVTDVMNDQVNTPGPGYRRGFWRRIMDAVWPLVLVIATASEAIGGSPITKVLTAPVRAVAAPFRRCVACERDADGNIKRSKAKARSFRRAVGWNLPTDGIRVDHIVALACGPDSGAYDDHGNMQLQWITDSVAKNAWELHPQACDPATQAAFLMSHGQLMPNAHSRTRPSQDAMLRAKRMREEYAAGRRR